MIVFIDTETTGLNPQQDRILQISALKVDDEFNEVGRWNHYIKPSGEYNISERAAEVHGLTKEFIEENGESLIDLADDLIQFINGCDVGGYNSNSFDWMFIYNELMRIGKCLDMNRVFYDVLSIERKLHPNNLGAVYQRYTGKTMEEADLKAHDAMSDVIATAAVMREQLKIVNSDIDTYGDIKTWSENQLISPEGSIRNAGDTLSPRIVFTRGKYRDCDVYDIAQTDPSYCKWWSQKVATTISRSLVKKYCSDRIKKA